MSPLALSIPAVVLFFLMVRETFERRRCRVDWA
jgi:hypothetical protein